MTYKFKLKQNFKGTLRLEQHNDTGLNTGMLDLFVGEKEGEKFVEGEEYTLTLSSGKAEETKKEVEKPKASVPPKA